jgi:F0F1-type ATP synthase membrane subunit b/b'
LAQSWIEFGKGSYDKVVEWTSRNIVERVANAIKDPEQAKQQAKAAIQSATTAAAKAVSDTANNIIQDANEKTGVIQGNISLVSEMM